MTQYMIGVRLCDSFDRPYLRSRPEIYLQATHDYLLDIIRLRWVALYSSDDVRTTDQPSWTAAVDQSKTERCIAHVSKHHRSSRPGLRGAYTTQCFFPSSFHPEDCHVIRKVHTASVRTTDAVRTPGIRATANRSVARYHVVYIHTYIQRRWRDRASSIQSIILRCMN